MNCINISEYFQKAHKLGHLIYFPSEIHHRPSHGIPYTVRLCPALDRKVQEAPRPEPGSIIKKNPFLPPEPFLIIHQFPKHTLLFNKYCVFPNHLLLITKQFIPQQDPLVLDDFQAAFETLSLINDEGNGWMLFYNSGPESGASQPHRHLQLIPGSNPPISQIFSDKKGNGGDDGIAIGPFKHIKHSLELFETKVTADLWYNTYRRMLEFSPVSGCSYSLVFTNKWMLLVPRRNEFSFGISYNSLSVAGYLLAKNRDELSIILDNDPLDILTNLAFPI